MKAVQCKKWTVDVVGVRHLRELLGSLDDHGAQEGAFVTVGRFTADAIAFAERRGLELIDGEGVLALIDGAPAPPPPISPAAHPDVRDMRCPRCAADLVVKVNRTTARQFLSCVRFPACKGSRPL